MLWQGPLGKGAKHPVPVGSPAVSVMKSLTRGPNGSPLGSSKMSDRVPASIGAELLPGSSRPVMKARSKLNETTGPLSVPVEATGFPSVRSLIEIVTPLTPALALRTTAKTATKSAIETDLNNSLCVICPPEVPRFSTRADRRPCRHLSPDCRARLHNRLCIPPRRIQATWMSADSGAVNPRG